MHFDLSVLFYFWYIHPKFGKFRHIPRYTVNPVFMTGIWDSVCVFRISENIGPFVTIESGTSHEGWVLVITKLLILVKLQGQKMCMDEFNQINNMHLENRNEWIFISFNLKSV